MNVLFIGNSYTYYNDMPRIFEALAKENGENISVDYVTRGGRKLYENLSAEDENHKIIEGLVSEKRYGVLFLQENSTYPITSYDEFLYGARELSILVSADRTIIYATWARKQGSPTLDSLNITRDEMSDGLLSAYENAARVLGAEISHVGKAFDLLYENHPEIELYAPDLTHPSYLGSVLAAITHFKTVFRRLPDSVASLNLDERTSNIIFEAIRE